MAYVGQKFILSCLISGLHFGELDLGQYYSKGELEIEIHQNTLQECTRPSENSCYVSKQKFDDGTLYYQSGIMFVLFEIF